ncbi:MAG TPA: MinD/ParA family protein [Candidatus Bathyarchaeia archaeon]
MVSVTFAVSKGGVGKSLLTANVAAALAARGKKVVLIEGDPNRPLQTIFGTEISSEKTKLEDIVKKDLDVAQAIYPTGIENLFLVPSGVSLEGYFDLDPIGFARKLAEVNADFIFIDVPFPMGEAAFLSLGVCQYFVVILTEDEFVLCVESAIDTIRLGRYLLKCVPIGFVLNKIKNPEKFNDEFVKDLEDLLEISCISKIQENPEISKSYGGVRSQGAFVAYQRLLKSEFAKSIDKIADALTANLPPPAKKDSVKLMLEVVGTKK